MLGTRASDWVVLALLPLVLLLAVACSGGDEPGTATATATPTSAPTSTPTAASTVMATPTPSIEDEVTAAYLAYWDAYSEAVLALDIGLVEGFAAGEELARVRGEIETLRGDGVAVRVAVEHNPIIVLTSETSATVVDEVTNNSFYVDAVTKDPPQAEGPGEVLRYTFFFEVVDGRWVVTRGLRDRSE
jgi:hypothetical protein